MKAILLAHVSLTMVFIDLTKVTGFSSNHMRRRQRIQSTILHGDPEKEATHEKAQTRRERIRKKVNQLAKSVVLKPINFAASQNPVGAVLADATVGAVDMAVEDFLGRKAKLSSSLMNATETAASTESEDENSPIENQLRDIGDSVSRIRASMREATSEMDSGHEERMTEALNNVVSAMVNVEQIAALRVFQDVYGDTLDNATLVDVSSLAFDDVDYSSSEMTPPFLDEDSCLVPGEPVVRVEKAPENSRRIFAGVDIPTSVDEVWNLLTDYEHLQDVVPNLVVNDVLEEYSSVNSKSTSVDANQSEELQCQELSRLMKGAKLRQVGGARVVGIQFSARTTLEVREWPQGLPDFAHFREELWDGQSRKARATAAGSIPLTRYRFPRPFAVSALPTKDISMQSVENDSGEFRMYQGVWRMQPLPGCAPAGQNAMRLTYAVEVSPRAYLPVRLVEGRIVRDLCANLEAIRDHLTAKVPV